MDKHRFSSITFTKVKSGDRWRVQLSLFGMIFTVSNTPMKFRPARDVNHKDKEAMKIKADLLLERGNRCELCGRKLNKDTCQMHHIKPVSVNPELRYDMGNMMLLCCDCHNGLHSAAIRKANELLAAG